MSASNIISRVKLALHAAHMLSSAISPGGTDRCVQMYNSKTRSEAEPEENLQGTGRQNLLLAHVQEREQTPAPSVGHNCVLTGYCAFLEH